MKNIFKFIFLFLFLFLSPNLSARADFSFNDMEINFVHVSDTHISDSPDTKYKVLSHSKELLDSAIYDINRMKGVDFVAFTGDMVNEPTKKLYRDFFISLTKLDYPSILVLGNHDSNDYAQDENILNKSAVASIIQRSNPYQNFQNTYFAYSPNKEYRIIVLDTTMGDKNTSNGYLPKEQLEFLDNEINNNQDKIILIFQHHPVIEPFKSESHALLNANEYLEVLKKYEKVPIGIFTGHYHAARITRKGNVIHCSTPSLVTYPNGYRFVRVTNYKDRVIFNFSFIETRLKSIQEISKSGIIATAAFAGNNSDKNDEIMIRKGYIPKEKVSKEDKKIEKEKKKAEKKQKKSKKQEKEEQIGI